MYFYFDKVLRVAVDRPDAGAALRSMFNPPAETARFSRYFIKTDLQEHYLH